MPCYPSNGLGKLFYELFWDAIKKSLIKGLAEIWHGGWMPESFPKGIIYLIPKSNDSMLHADLKKWRPITILNTN